MSHCPCCHGFGQFDQSCTRHPSDSTLLDALPYTNHFTKCAGCLVCGATQVFLHCIMQTSSHRTAQVFLIWHWNRTVAGHHQGDRSSRICCRVRVFLRTTRYQIFCQYGIYSISSLSDIYSIFYYFHSIFLKFLYIFN